jgi:hypothetical protein
MSLQIIKRTSEGTNKETISRIRNDQPQIAYNSEGRVSVRIPQDSGDVLIVFDRPLSRELIRFLKNGVVEGMDHQTWCAGCGQELDDRLPF